jgi:hypothetical protein
VVFGDNRPAKGDPQPETIKEIFIEIKELHPAFAMSLGDVIEGKPKQIAQLRADLEANRDKAHIFITMHYPIHAKDQGPPDSTWDDRLYPESRKALIEMFKDYDNIAYVRAAHEHLYYNPQSPEDVANVPGWKTGNPIVYLVSGGAGAPLNDGKWGFHNYLVFTVDGANVSAKLVKLESTGSSS